LINMTKIEKCPNKKQVQLTGAWVEPINAKEKRLIQSEF